MNNRRMAIVGVVLVLIVTTLLLAVDNGQQVPSGERVPTPTTGLQTEPGKTLPELKQTPARTTQVEGPTPSITPEPSGHAGSIENRPGK